MMEVNYDPHSSPHPPPVVSLNPAGVSDIEAPHPDSPLSSAPNSPNRGMIHPGDWHEAASIDQGVGEIEPFPDDMPTKEAVPFDESGSAPADEKKVDEGDELMGKQPPSRKATSYDDDDDDCSQPPSLSKAKTPPADRSPMSDDINSMEEDGVIPMRSQQKIRQPEPMEDDKITFPAKSDVEDPNEDDRPQKPPRRDDSVVRTPVQGLRSPPKVTKQTLWSTDRTKPTTSDRPGDSIDLEDDSSDPGMIRSSLNQTAVVSPSSSTKASSSSATKNNETTNNVSHAKGNHTPTMKKEEETRKPMPTHSNDDDGERRLSSSDNFWRKAGNTMLGQVFHGLNGSSVPPTSERTIVKKEDEPGKIMQASAVMKSIGDPSANSIQESTNLPFHPTGSLMLRKPVKPQLGRSITAPAVRPDAELALPEPSFQEFASTLSDAVGLATSGAEAVSDMVLGRYDCGQEELLQTRQRFSLARSVSEQPSGTAVAKSHDWGEYLQTRGVDLSSGSGALAQKWMAGASGSGGDKEYRKMTPKKDFQSSEKTAGWLREELQRRSVIKKEINDAILARNDDETSSDPVVVNRPKVTSADSGSEMHADDSLSEDMSHGDEAVNNSFTKKLSSALGKLPTESLEGSGDVSESTADEEVAAITKVPLKEQQLEQDLQVGSEDNLDKPTARKLNYGDLSASNTGSSVHDDSIASADADGNRLENPVLKVLSSPRGASVSSSSKERTPPLEDHLEHEMQKFASDTRAALRGNEPKGGGPNKLEQQPLNSQFRPLNISKSPAFEVQTELRKAFFDDGKSTGSHSARKSDRPSPAPRGINLLSSSSEGNSDGIESVDINVAPILVESMDSEYGILKGDITLSLLNENNRSETSKTATWANRVRGAIWRCRRMRQRIGEFLPKQREQLPGSPAKGRQSLPVDLDRARVAGGVRSVESTQKAALSHLEHDEIDEAVELFEDIIFAYYAYFERTLQAREENPSQLSGSTDFKRYIGVALHNLGILNLLKGEYKQALSYFRRAVDNRMSCLGEGHPEHVASLVKLAICHYALNEFGRAHAGLEEALEYAKWNSGTLEDRMLKAEILNNLGCLAYMCGQPVPAKAFFRESLDEQFGVLTDSLYQNTSVFAESISLNISITRANIGFVKLVTKDVEVAVTALENALMEQQILLHGAHETVIATMDHLAVANLLNGNQEKAAQMYGRILRLQENEFGPHDRRCFVTREKINMLQSQGQNFEEALEELRKTFTMPEASRPKNRGSPLESSREAAKARPQDMRREAPKEAPKQTNSTTKNKPLKNKGVLQAISSAIRKKSKGSSPIHHWA